MIIFLLLFCSCVLLFYLYACILYYVAVHVYCVSCFFFDFYVFHLYSGSFSFFSLRLFFHLYFISFLSFSLLLLLRFSPFGPLRASPGAGKCLFGRRWPCRVQKRHSRRPGTPQQRRKREQRQNRSRDSSEGARRRKTRTASENETKNRTTQEATLKKNT